MSRTNVTVLATMASGRSAWPEMSSPTFSTFMLVPRTPRTDITSAIESPIVVFLSAISRQIAMSNPRKAEISAVQLMEPVAA